MTTLRYGLISDTHGAVHKDVFTHFDGVKAILHAGDVGGSVYEELKVIAPVFAVCGNTDYAAPHLPASRAETLEFGVAGIAHGHLQAVNWEDRVRDLYRLFQPNEARLILTGHSHQQYMQLRGGVWLVNPGAASRPRFKQQSGLCVLEWDSDRDLLNFNFRSLDWS